ncbi:MAG: hypothetical protein AVO35_08970 [Candidatus Aegiribacteria sp. MLS_C]|nr:MAG: hypothetical protein AVO35_08970 [Candidatus Aegiribacteria sp. MLS_C]
MERPDPLFPSEEALRDAGLDMTPEGELGLPSLSGFGASGRTAFQLLKGERYGRTVRSGIQRTGDGRTLVRTGVTSSTPSFCCSLEDGHLVSYNSPVEVNSLLLSGRTGPGRVSIVNDGRWLVIDRLLPRSEKQDETWLLLRQLRDISIAEMLSVPCELVGMSEGL